MNDHAATDSGAPPATSTSNGMRWEILIVATLGLTALATAWSGYQASLWDGVQSSSYTQASAARTAAAQQRTEANQFRLADLSVFQGYIDALISGNNDVAAFYRDRFREEFDVAFQAWTALNPLQDATAPSSPLAMPEYQLAPEQAALELETRADALFAEGERANDHSDTYTLTTLLFAVVLFLAAIAQRFHYVRARIALLTLAALALVAGVTVALSQPITGG